MRNSPARVPTLPHRRRQGKRDALVASPFGGGAGAAHPRMPCSDSFADWATTACASRAAGRPRRPAALTGWVRGRYIVLTGGRNRAECSSTRALQGRW